MIRIRAEVALRLALARERSDPTTGRPGNSSAGWTSACFSSQEWTDSVPSSCACACSLCRSSSPAPSAARPATAAPASALCDDCAFGFDVTATPDAAASTLTTCEDDLAAWSATLAFAPSPAAYAGPLLYVWDDTGWAPWAYATFSADGVEGVDGTLDDPYVSYGATYYASDYARTALTPE